jgi:predicted Zn-dependent protease
VEEAVFSAGLSTNPPYILPDPKPMTKVQAADPALMGDSKARMKALDELTERILAAAAAEKGIRLATCEIFMTATDYDLRSSAGVEAASQGTQVELELVVLARDGDREAEAHLGIGGRRVQDLHVEREVKALAQQARDSLAGVLPQSRKGPVVISNGAFLPFFEPIRFATSGAALYRKLSPQVAGKSLFGERKVRGDRLDLASDPTLAFGGETAPFDEEGLALNRVAVIGGGTFLAPATSKRYADYLKIPATGDWTNMVMAAGAQPQSALLDAGGAPLLHVVEFSWLNPDNVSGDFSTEIRLAYELGPGGRKVIRGGSLAGNAYDAFAAAHFSQETELRENYQGPVAIRFDELQITGG